MILSMEGIQKKKAGMFENKNTMSGHPGKEMFDLMLDYADFIETIEAQRQEIERLKKRLQVSPYGDDKIDELEEAIENLRFQNKQLQAQAAQMREALAFGISLVDMICTANKREGEEPTAPSEFRFYEKAQKALSYDAGKGYHNPADLEEIERLKANNKQLDEAAKILCDGLNDFAEGIAKAIGGQP